jgi:hypothetical protein
MLHRYAAETALVAGECAILYEIVDPIDYIEYTYIEYIGYTCTSC